MAAEALGLDSKRSAYVTVGAIGVGTFGLLAVASVADGGLVATV